jgi:glutamate synthase (NADPH/NADH) small chain
VTIGQIEKYITDTAFAQGWRPDMSGVVPTGFQGRHHRCRPGRPRCRRHPVRDGVKPVVFDRYPQIGGLLTFGIPGSNSRSRWCRPAAR